jgi:fatty acid synthase subunit beta
MLRTYAHNFTDMDESSLRRVLAIIAGQSNGLMEIVNFNVRGEQYVAAGHASIFTSSQFMLLTSFLAP